MFSSPLKIQVDSSKSTSFEQQRPNVFEEQSDEAIWKSFKDGDEGAFVFIYKKYANPLYNLGYKYTTDQELVKDCLQDFFVYLRRSRLNLSNTNSIKLYLMKSFRRRVIEYIKKQQNEQKKNLKVSFEFQLDVESSHEMKFIDLQYKKEQTERVKRALDKLEGREKEAVYYYYYEGLGYKEIAEVLEFTHVSSARRLIYRAISRLRDLF